MNRNVLIVMAGGFLVAVLVAMIVQSTLKTDRKKAPITEDRVQIVVAAKALKSGETLSATNMKWQDWPKAGVFDGMIVKEENKSITDVAEGKVKRAMTINEPITKSSLVVAKANYLASSLTPGMRAVSIGGNANSAVAGFVTPGDHVDIILTYRTRFSLRNNDSSEAHDVMQRNIYRRASETILQNIKVLAVDTAVTRNEEKVKAGKIYTMEVTPKQAQFLALAGSVGSLEMALRGIGDDKIANPRLPAATDARMTQLYGELVEALKDARGGSASSVRIFNGNSINQIVVNP